MPHGEQQAHRGFAEPQSLGGDCASPLCRSEGPGGVRSCVSRLALPSERVANQSFYFR